VDDLADEVARRAHVGWLDSTVPEGPAPSETAGLATGESGRRGRGRSPRVTPFGGHSPLRVDRSARPVGRWRAGRAHMKLSVTKVLALVALGAIPLAGCNTIKGLLGDKEAPTTEAEPTTEATETAPPASAPAETAAPDVSAAPSAEVPAIVAVNAADIKR